MRVQHTHFTLPWRGRVGDALNEVRREPGWGERLKLKAHPTPPTFASLRRATLPLQGRVKKECASGERKNRYPSLASNTAFSEMRDHAAARSRNAT